MPGATPGRPPTRSPRPGRTTATAPAHRLCALGTVPPEPGSDRAQSGLSPGSVRAREGGGAIAAEVRQPPAEGRGTPLADLPRPMALDSVELTDGTFVPGLLREPGALGGVRGITSSGGRRAARLASASAGQTKEASPSRKRSTSSEEL
ncbi:hypothetical protein [Streptomyces sp. NPDC093094]|uniref:allophanate hydrolase-related protein n=1 Tax=Streptomyces sp. NPDC093094 TaxID=3366026 RepID=UPI0037F3664C